MTALEDLRELLPEPVVVVDVGCRWGFASHWERLGAHVTLVGFDASESEVERLRAEFRDRENMRFYARTLGSQPGRGTLIHRVEEAGTSLLRTDWSHLAHLPNYEAARETRESQVSVSTLDQWIDEEGSEARVDALKLDTQGSELDILRGALKPLSSARHIEVEVSFNPLFLGGPLFGEVDAFLRARGFVLWRLRDPMYHALREAPDPPVVTEEIWYEGRPQAVPMRGGQLVWCNAHFVREDMYRQGRQLGWEARIRDYCLMEALEFHDLATVSLKRVMKERGCPDGVLSEAERALGERSDSISPAAGPEHQPTSTRTHPATA